VFSWAIFGDEIVTLPASTVEQEHKKKTPDKKRIAEGNFNAQTSVEMPFGTRVHSETVPDQVICQPR